VSIAGALFTAKRTSAQLKELAVEGSTHNQAVDFTGFASPDVRALYRPDWVALEGRDGRLLTSRKVAAEEFCSALESATWDPLQVAYYCGYLIWNHLVTLLSG